MAKRCAGEAVGSDSANRKKVMLVVVDTDIVNKLSRMPNFNELRANLRKHCLQVTTSETVVKEILATANPAVRTDLSNTLLCLIEECPLLASLPYQIKWGVHSFLSGKTTFKPFRAVRSDDIKKLLRKAEHLTNSQIEAIRQEAANAIHRWDEMHGNGRPNMQPVLEKSGVVPDAGDWMNSIHESEFMKEVVLGIVSKPSEKKELIPRVSEYIEWNPICRCFLEQLMLAIRRHGLEQQTSSSKKGPKWADYYISAFVGITDYFVTDDTRLLRALKQHRGLRSPARSWELRSLNEFIADLRDNLILCYATNRTLETWPPGEH
jgi:hypothetical protein